MGWRSCNSYANSGGLGRCKSTQVFMSESLTTPDAAASRYIQYETRLEELRKLRKEAAGLAGTMKSLADHALVRRIHFIFERATRKFRGDLALWHAWLRFCKDSRSARQMSKVSITTLLFPASLATGRHLLLSLQPAPCFSSPVLSVLLAACREDSPAPARCPRWAAPPAWLAYCLETPAGVLTASPNLLPDGIAVDVVLLVTACSDAFMVGAGAVNKCNAHCLLDLVVSAVRCRWRTNCTCSQPAGRSDGWRRC